MCGRLWAGAARAVMTVLAALAVTACQDRDRSSSAGSGNTKTTPAAEAAKSSSSTQRGSFKCDPADANRPDKPRGKMVAGTIPAPVPRRTCTLPQRGCVTGPGGESVVVPPAPGIDIARVTTSIEVAYDLGADLDECQPSQVRVTVHTTVSGSPPYGDAHPVSGRTGTLRIARQELPGNVDYGPPDMLVVSSTTARGFSSGSAIVRLPPPEGEQRLSDAEVRRIEARREACRADIGDRTTCRQGARVPVSGPVTKGTTTDLERSVRASLRAHAYKVLDLECFNGTRCDAAFTTGSYRFEMSYQIRALKSVPTCWELTAWSVTRPVPELDGIAAPIPPSGCAYP